MSFIFSTMNIISSKYSVLLLPVQIELSKLLFYFKMKTSSDTYSDLIIENENVSLTG